MRVMVKLGLSVVALVVVVSKAVKGIPVEKFFPFGAQVNDRHFSSGLDEGSENITLHAPLKFYGKSFPTLHVNINGYISVSGPLAFYENKPLNLLSKPGIAVFYSDVDTRHVDQEEATHGQVYFRETFDKEILQRGASLVKDSFPHALDFTPTAAFIATWQDVGYFQRQGDKRNTFQTVLIYDDEDTYCVFYYATNGINWIRPESKIPDEEALIAQAGFLSEDSAHFYPLAGSGTEEMERIDETTNIANSDGGEQLYHISLQDVEDPRNPMTNVAQTGAGDYNGEEDEGPDEYDDATEEQPRTTRATHHTFDATEPEIRMEIITPQATPTCGENEQFQDCGTACPPTCDSPQPEICTLQCVQDCFCIPGFVRHQAKCVKPEDCPRTTTAAKQPTVPYFPPVPSTTVRGCAQGSESDCVGQGCKWVPDTLGCGVCTCDEPLPATQTDCPAPVFECDEPCRWTVDASGCRLCACEPEPERTTERVCPQHTCDTSRCRWGYDAQGCPICLCTENAECPPRPQDCPEPQCRIQQDQRGCQTCSCAAEHGRPEPGIELCAPQNTDCRGAGCRWETDASGCRTCRCSAAVILDGYPNQAVYPTPLQPPAQTHSPVCRPADRTCADDATCKQYSDGHCCECNANFFGNGKMCFPNDEPQRLSGGFLGKINGIELTERDMHTYVVTTDGRTYVAVSQIANRLGHPGVVLIPTVGNVMGWLFAKVDSPGAYNGFMMTGGVFNRTANVHISVDGRDYSIYLQQDFSGKDAYQSLKARTFASGNLPDVESSEVWEMNDYEQSYRRVQPGIIKSYSQHTMRVAGKTYQVTVDQTISYFECPFGLRNRNVGDVTTLHVSRLYVQYVQDEQTLRVSMQNAVTLSRDVDPCRSGAHRCTQSNMVCAVDGLSYKCLCTEGFQLVGDSCEDVDECALSLHRCSQNAECRNLPGSHLCLATPAPGQQYGCGTVVCSQHADCLPGPHESTLECVCRMGYHGDGTNCTPLESGEGTSCRSHEDCARYAECAYDQNTHETKCRCQQGYSGDGISCRPDGFEPPETAIYCRRIEDCGPHADCIFDQTSRTNLCRCQAGYVGDGRVCQSAGGSGSRPSEGQSCSGHNDCGRFAECIYNDAIRSYQCRCQRGFSGDGQICQRELETCDVAFNCDSNAECVLEQTEIGPGYVCRCKTGFSGDGFRCRALNPPSMLSCNVLNNCHPNAQCKEDQNNAHFCECLPEFVGDGYDCRPVEEGPRGTPCRNIEDCNENAHCVHDESTGQYVCQCVPGFRGDGLEVCEPSEECTPQTSRDDCDINARCAFVEAKNALACVCQPGYTGSGKVCTLASGNPDTGDGQGQGQGQGCDVLRNCHPYADCILDSLMQQYACRCRPGYAGDGYNCRTTSTGCEVLRNCHPNARCNYASGGYVCQCNPGYVGDGFNCQRQITCIEQPNCDINADCVRDFDGQYRCKCGRGFIGNGQSCMPESEMRGRKLLYAQNMAILQRGLAPDEIGKQIVSIPSAILVAVAYHCNEQRVYFSDISEGAIYSSSLDGTNITKLVSEGVNSPEGIAIDQAGGNLYWTDSGTNEISVISLDGRKNRRILIKDNLVDPRPIVVDPANGVMYWADWNRAHPSISRANMDGTNRQIFVEGASELNTPNGLVILQGRQELCWVDAGMNRLECKALNGNTRRVIYAPLNWPFGLTAYNEETFFWTDWKDFHIHSINIYGANLRSFPPSVGNQGKLYGIVAVPDSCPRPVNPCSTSNESGGKGSCSSSLMCLPKESGHVCVCPDNVADASACNELALTN